MEAAMRAKELAAKVRISISCHPSTHKTSLCQDTLCGEERKLDTGREKARKGSTENKIGESKEDVSGREGRRT
jgi:hypothetical protein